MVGRDENEMSFVTVKNPWGTARHASHAPYVMRLACLPLAGGCRDSEKQLFVVWNQMNNTPKEGESVMAEKEHLYILWTNADPITADKMVFMYGLNAIKREWWKEVTLIIWGSPARLSAENDEIREKIKQLIAAGVHVTACKACADQLGVTEVLEKEGIEVKYWGVPLTDLLKSDEKLLTI